jgi:putative iron-dependent peroxidase
MPEPQPAINEPQTRFAIFLVYGVTAGPTHTARVRDVCGNLDALVRAVGARAPDAALDVAVGLGSDAWDRIVGPPRPAELHPFREFRAGTRIAPATPGDLFFHVTANDMGVAYELAAQIFAQLVGSVSLIDETHGFRYFDDRDLTGFVDGTENPVGAASVAATIIGDEDPVFAGGSYVMVQKYVHDHFAWNALSTEVQEGIMGRRKLDDIELDDDVKPASAHIALTVIEENGEEVQIRRHNMPFGSAGGGESGTYFIGYARSPRVLEQMLENMVVGRPPGAYDRLLDFTHPVTGSLFFVPSLDLLAAWAAGDAHSMRASGDELFQTDGQAAPAGQTSRAGQFSPASPPAPAGPPSPSPRTAPDTPSPDTVAPAARRRDGSLNIGSLKGTPQHG